MQTVSFSQKGTKSDKNEDACLSFPCRGLFVVADGVGGGPSGDVASRTIVETLCAELDGITLSENAIVASIESANRKIYQSAQADSLAGMASTVTIGWKSDDSLYCFNVGDSRIYLVREGRIRQLTHDHTKAVQKGPNRIKQVVTNAVGIRPELKVEVQRFDLEVGDMFALMSDGISDLVDDEAIVSVLSSQQFSLVQKARALVEESEKRGGRDDKSIILAVVE